MCECRYDMFYYYLDAAAMQAEKFVQLVEFAKEEGHASFRSISLLNVMFVV